MKSVNLLFDSIISHGVISSCYNVQVYSDPNVIFLENGSKICFKSGLNQNFKYSCLIWLIFVKFPEAVLFHCRFIFQDYRLREENASVNAILIFVVEKIFNVSSVSNQRRQLFTSSYSIGNSCMSVSVFHDCYGISY